MNYYFKRFLTGIILLMFNAFSYSSAKAQSVEKASMDIKFSSELHPEGTKIKLYREWPNRKLIDTGILGNGSGYTFHVTDSLPAVFTLQCRKPFINQTIILEKGMCSVKYTSNSELIVKGSTLQNSLENYKKQIEPLEKAWAATGNQYLKAANLDEKLVAEKENAIQAEKVTSARLAFIKNNVNNAVGQWLAYSYLNLWQLKDLKTLEVYFYPSRKTNHVSDEIERRLQLIERNILVGKKAPSFTLHAMNGSNVSLSSILKTNKYLLIDVWASWCTPCRAANRKLSPVYAELKKKGIEFVSISVDDHKDAWEKAVKDDKIPWMQLLSDNAMKGTFTESYQVKSLPTTFLVNSDGIIIKQNASIKDLQNL